MVLPPLELFSLRKEPPFAGWLFPFFDHRSFTFPAFRPASVFPFCLRSEKVDLAPPALPNRKATIQFERQADVAQLVEQLIRNQQVAGSNPAVGSR